MDKFLAIPKSVIGFIESPIFASSFRTTSLFTIGAVGYIILSSLIGQRLTTLLTIAVVLIRLIPIILTTTGAIPNDQLQHVVKGKSTVLFPHLDGTPSKPGDTPLALLILGIYVSHPLCFFSPGAKEVGDYFLGLVKELNDNPTEHGWLGGSVVQGQPDSPTAMGHYSIIGYFKTMDHLHRFAHGASHRDAWNWWNRNVKNMPHIGVYHEAYDIPSRHYEAVYLQTPKLGLGATKVEVKTGEWKGVIADARKGVLRSSAGRMGREEGKTYDDDPYKTD